MTTEFFKEPIKNEVKISLPALGDEKYENETKSEKYCLPEINDVYEKDVKVNPDPEIFNFVSFDKEALCLDFDESKISENQVEKSHNIQVQVLKDKIYNIKLAIQRKEKEPEEEKSTEQEAEIKKNSDLTSKTQSDKSKYDLATGLYYANLNM